MRTDGKGKGGFRRVLWILQFGRMIVELCRGRDEYFVWI